jgi:hypothetical protein
MAGWRRVVELTMTDEEIERLTVLSRSRTEPASRVSRAQMLLAYRKNSSFCAVGQRVGVHHQTVQRCVERALAASTTRREAAGLAAAMPAHLATRDAVRPRVRRRPARNTMRCRASCRSRPTRAGRQTSERH